MEPNWVEKYCPDYRERLLRSSLDRACSALSRLETLQGEFQDGDLGAKAIDLDNAFLQVAINLRRVRDLFSSWDRASGVQKAPRRVDPHKGGDLSEILDKTVHHEWIKPTLEIETGAMSFADLHVKSDRGEIFFDFKRFCQQARRKLDAANAHESKGAA